MGYVFSNYKGIFLRIKQAMKNRRCIASRDDRFKGLTIKQIDNASALPFP